MSSFPACVYCMEHYTVISQTVPLHQTLCHKTPSLILCRKTPSLIFCRKTPSLILCSKTPSLILWLSPFSLSVSVVLSSYCNIVFYLPFNLSFNLISQSLCHYPSPSPLSLILRWIAMGVGAIVNCFYYIQYTLYRNIITWSIQELLLPLSYSK